MRGWICILPNKITNEVDVHLKYYLTLLVPEKEEQEIEILIS